MPDGGMLFVGAGASKPFGLPLMLEYLAGFREFLSSRRRKDLFPSYDRLCKILRLYDNDLEDLYTALQDLIRPSHSLLNPASALILESEARLNVEDLFQILSRSGLGQYAELLGLLEEYILISCEISNFEAVKGTYDALFLLLMQSWFIRSDGGKTGYPFATGTVLAGRGPQDYFPALPIVTTNYDLALEIYLNYRQVKFLDGFERGPGGVLRFEPRVFRQPGREPAVRLLKLHGSVDWKRTEEGSIIQAETGRGKTTSRREIVSSEAMIFPTRDKPAANWPFFDLLSTFVDILRETRFWFVIGYSFRDSILRRVFLDNLGRDRFLVVLAPRATNLVEKLRRDKTPSTPDGHIVAIDAKFGEASALELLRRQVMDRGL